MPIVSDGQLNLQALALSDVYIVVILPQTPIIAGVPTSGVGLVGTAQKGPINTPVLIGDVASLVRTFGDIDNTGTYDLVTEAIGALKQGADTLYCVRVHDGTASSAATKLINNVAGSTGITFTAGSQASGTAVANNGAWANGSNAVIQVGVGSNNTATANTGTLTVVGTTAGVVIITVGSNAVTGIDGSGNTYTVVSGDTTASIANAIASRINNDANSKILVVATVSGSVVTVTSLTPGTTATSGGTIALSVSGAQAANVTAGGLSGGNLSGGTGTATFRVVITANNEIPEVYDNLANIAAIVSAVNNGLTGQRGASALFYATAGTGTYPRVQSTLTNGASHTSGNNGYSGITTNSLLGVDGLTRTGMYALRAQPITQFGIAGLTDSTAWPTMVSFGKDENCIAVLCLPKSTGAQAAVSAKITAAIDDYRAVMVKDFLWLNDTKNNVIRLVPPTGPLLGKLGALSPERSPGNKPLYGYLGTERTGYISANGAFVAGIPYSNAEMSLLESNGILFATAPSVGGNYLAFRHGQNTSSNSTTNGINYSRMTIFLSESLDDAMGFAVNEVHTPQLRQRVKTSIAQFLGSLADPGPGRSPMIGDVNGGPAFSIVCDASNNPDNMVALGYMQVYVQVKYLSIVRFFIINLEAGQSTTIRVQSSPVA